MLKNRLNFSKTYFLKKSEIVLTEDAVTVFEKENDDIIPLTKKSFSDKSQVNGSKGKHSDVNELKLENLIIDNPELIPAERFNASKWIPVAKQVTLEDHFPDTIGVDDIGQLYIIENKLDNNSDKKTVRSQIKEYAFGLRKLGKKLTDDKGWQEFLDLIKDANNSNIDDVKRRKNLHGKSLEDILLDNFNGDPQKSQECLQNIKRNFEDGKIILIIAIDKIRRNLRTSIDGENELDGKILPIFALEVNEYTTKKDETIIISSTYPFDLDDLVDKKDADRIRNDHNKFDEKLSMTNLSVEQKIIFEQFKNKLSGICKLVYNTGDKPAIKTRFVGIKGRSPIMLYSDGDLRLYFRTLDSAFPEKRKKYKDGLEENSGLKKLIKNKILDVGENGHIVFPIEQWIPFSDHIFSVLKKVFVDE
jgi:hypothetical protein